MIPLLLLGVVYALIVVGSYAASPMSAVVVALIPWAFRSASVALLRRRLLNTCRRQGLTIRSRKFGLLTQQLTAADDDIILEVDLSRQVGFMAFAPRRRVEIRPAEMPHEFSMRPKSVLKGLFGKLIGQLDGEVGFRDDTDFESHVVVEGDEVDARMLLNAESRERAKAAVHRYDVLVRDGAVVFSTHKHGRGETIRKARMDAMIVLAQSLAARGRTPQARLFRNGEAEPYPGLGFRAHRALVERWPHSPEAQQACDRLCHDITGRQYSKEQRTRVAQAVAHSQPDRLAAVFRDWAATGGEGEREILLGEVQPRRMHQRARLDSSEPVTWPKALSAAANSAAESIAWRQAHGGEGRLTLVDPHGGGGLSLAEGGGGLALAGPDSVES